MSCVVMHVFIPNISLLYFNSQTKWRKMCEGKQQVSMEMFKQVSMLTLDSLLKCIFSVSTNCQTEKWVINLNEFLFILYYCNIMLAQVAMFQKSPFFTLSNTWHSSLLTCYHASWKSLNTFQILCPFSTTCWILSSLKQPKTLLLFYGSCMYMVYLAFRIVFNVVWCLCLFY